ncbi:MAG: hypothetical protein ACREFE_11535 [Limisphaerales bacterium]
MKLSKILPLIATIILVGCATKYPVTLSRTTEVYSGILKFDGPYTGTLTIPKGPKGESFTGRYVATDMSPNTFAVGGSGQIEAHGVWTGRGDHGSLITADVKVGREGHGIGIAKDTNGNEYQISF